MSSGGGGASGPLVPTFHGFVQTSMDGLVLFEGCLSGKLHHVPRRPHDRERTSLIKSGSIFIYEENASGIKRWTDGVAWSPSRILGNFLIYRELEKPFPPGEKKRAMKRKRTSEAGEPYPRRDSNINDHEPLDPPPLTPPSPNTGESKPEANGTDQDKELERSLIGSLVDSYGFRPDGLVKKTMSISIDGVSHHMVSYYKVEDVKNNVLPRPQTDPLLQNISVRPELYLRQNFRSPVEETDHYAIDGNLHAHPHLMYAGVPYGMRPGQYMGAYPNMYGVSPTTSPYGNVSGASWPTQPVSAGAMSYGNHSGYSGSPYGAYYKPQSSGNEKPNDPQHSPHEMTYGNGYNNAYSTGVQQRTGSWQSSMPLNTSSRDSAVERWSDSHHQTPVQQTQSHFARPSYSGPSITSPTTNGQQQHSYPGSAQSYAVRSPTQSYGIQSAPNSAIPQSPHHSVKRTSSADPASATSANDSQISYRTGSYAVGGAAQSTLSNGVGGSGGGGHGGGSGSPTTDMSGLGISTGGTYGSTGASQHSHSNSAGGTNYSYPASAVATGLPTYRSVAGELASAAQAQTAHHYAQ